MSTNCIRCVKRKRTGSDLLCDRCRDESNPHGRMPSSRHLRVLRECAITDIKNPNPNSCCQVSGHVLKALIDAYMERATFKMVYDYENTGDKSVSVTLAVAPGERVEQMVRLTVAAQNETLDSLELAPTAEEIAAMRQKVETLTSLIERWRSTMRYYTGTAQPEPARVALRWYNEEVCKAEEAI